MGCTVKWHSVCDGIVRARSSIISLGFMAGISSILNCLRVVHLERTTCARGGLNTSCWRYLGKSYKRGGRGPSILAWSYCKPQRTVAKVRGDNYSCLTACKPRRRAENVKDLIIEAQIAQLTRKPKQACITFNLTHSHARAVRSAGSEESN